MLEYLSISLLLCKSCNWVHFKLIGTCVFLFNGGTSDGLLLNIIPHQVEQPLQLDQTNVTLKKHNANAKQNS